MIGSRIFKAGMFFNVDTTTKFVEDETILNYIEGLKEEGYSNKEIEAIFTPPSNANLDFKRKVVMTKYNNKQYQIDGLSFSKTPKTVIFEWKDKAKIRFKTDMVEYFRIMHGIVFTPA